MKKDGYAGILDVADTKVLRQLKMITLDKDSILTFLFSGINHFQSNTSNKTQKIPVFIYDNKLIWLSFEDIINEYVIPIHA